MIGTRALDFHHDFKHAPAFTVRQFLRLAGNTKNRDAVDAHVECRTGQPTQTLLVKLPIGTERGRENGVYTAERLHVK